MAENNSSPSSSEVKDLLKKGSQYLLLGKHEKALRYFNRACNLEPDNITSQHWCQRAEWLINYFSRYRGPNGDLSQQDCLATTISQKDIKKIYNPKFERLRTLHLDYGIFLAQLGEYEDSEREALWLIKNGGKDLAKQVRHHILICNKDDKNLP